MINEIGNTVTVFAYDQTAGELSQLQELSTLPDDYGEASGTADIHVSPDGRFLYGSNRGHDSIAMYGIGEDGRLAPLGHEQVPATPRGFALDPGGTLLLSAGQSSDTIQSFRRDGASGLLQATADPTEVPSPVCLKFLELS